MRIKAGESHTGSQSSGDIRSESKQTEEGERGEETIDIQSKIPQRGHGLYWKVF